MQNNKGVSMVMTAVIVAVLLFLYFLFASGFLGKGFGIFGAGYDELERKADARSCSVQAGLTEVLFDKDFGTKGDGLGDACDFCLGGDDNKDDDGDGIPNACDPYKKQPPERKAKMKSLCEHKDIKGSWDDKRKQCTLPCYVNPKETCPVL